MYNNDDLSNLCVQVFKPHSEMFHLWDQIAKNLQPEFATFHHSYQQNYAYGLATSEPITMFRDLADSVGTVLRYGDWFEPKVKGVEEGDASYDWLQRANLLMKEQMGPKSGFNASSKIHDRQYLLWGNSPKSITMNRDRSGLLYRTHRLQDVAWTEDYAGNVEIVVRKWKGTYHQASQMFDADKLDSNFNKMANSREEKFNKCDLRHIVMPSELYGDPSITNPFVSIWFDLENSHKIECIGINYNEYVISRYFPIPGTPYSFSPVATTALIDARTLQLITNTVMDAAERYVRPPIIATRKAIVGSLDLTGRSATWVDQNYDERMGDPLRTLDMGGAGAYPLGQDMHDRMKQQLGEDLYKEKLTLPEPTATASEWNDRMEAYRLGVVPILQPLIDEDSDKVCNLEFDIMMANNMFGSPEDIPEQLQGQDVEFSFSSPLTQTEDQKVMSNFMRSVEVIQATLPIYPEVKDVLEPTTAILDVMRSSGVKSHWIRSEEDIEETLVKNQQEQELMKATAMAQEMGSVATQQG